MHVDAVARRSGTRRGIETLVAQRGLCAAKTRVRRVLGLAARAVGRIEPRRGRAAVPARAPLERTWRSAWPVRRHLVARFRARRDSAPRLRRPLADARAETRPSTARRDVRDARARRNLHLLDRFRPGGVALQPRTALDGGGDQCRRRGRRSRGPPPARSRALQIPSRRDRMRDVATPVAPRRAPLKWTWSRCCWGVGSRTGNRTRARSARWKACPQWGWMRWRPLPTVRKPRCCC